ncbi:ParA family protein [Coleofasciculus sp.]|uniref:ParA family protein n=1 Tax=Coleofasciculus sp. TaxID=3100458 RepID=UPI003A1C25E3
MKAMRLLTWLDVRRVIRRETNYGSRLPKGIVSIRSFSDAIEIGLWSEDYLDNAKQALKEWFGDWYQQDDNLIQLDLGEVILPVEFIHEEESGDTYIPIRPFWEEVAYLQNNGEPETEVPKNLHIPEAYPSTSPQLVAFYSFKGGVGRTLHLAAHLFALLERTRELNQAKTFLVVDADLEAPGLTYWNRSEKQQPTVSFINFLEAYHASALEPDRVLSFFAKELKKSPKRDGKSTIYFLPACLGDRELLDTPILPEHLVRTIDGAWEFGNALSQLGQAVDADYVLIDLRSGLSEISSPIIFDPRIQRFIVTTINDQSVNGSSLVLQQLSHTAPPETDVEEEGYYDPLLLITLLTPELKSLPAFDEALSRFQAAYIQSQGDIYQTRLKIKETDFTQELLYLNNWEDARSKLSPTSVMKVAKEWAESQLIKPKEQRLDLATTQDSDPLAAVRRLRDVCQQYEYAESGQGENLLVTEPLKNLATTFRDELPRVVSIGSKGSGKTFNYIQLSRLKYWQNFIQRVLGETNESEAKTYVFPMLQSLNLRDNAIKIIQEARNEVISASDNSFSEFSQSEYNDKIQAALANSNWGKQEWTQFWIKEIARTVGLDPETKDYWSFNDINNALKQKSLRVIFLFDGLEDIFSDASSNPIQQAAIESLIRLPARLSEIRKNNLGLIIFIRRDFVRYAITHNLSQFENLYGSYDLYWDADSFMNLVFWVCSQAQVIDADESELDSMTREQLIEKLENLWGKKLGSDKSKEAYTPNWVFAALTDFKGRLQARDIVRFLYHAADETIENAKEIQFEKWSTSRLLPPQAIRRALEPCSKKKVQEAKEEYLAFRTWVNTLQSKDPKEMRVPFTLDNFDIEPSTLSMLEEIGVVYEDRAKDDTPRYYMPEIFRAGLEFTLNKGARPRVVVLKRKALGSGII